ncbi:hypothetical protein ACFL0V_01010 [Nanoarchaeota archaeon]
MAEREYFERRITEQRTNRPHPRTADHGTMTDWLQCCLTISENAEHEGLVDRREVSIPYSSMMSALFVGQYERALQVGDQMMDAIGCQITLNVAYTHYRNRIGQ